MIGSVRPSMAGRLVRLQPLTEDHAAALLASVSSEEVWAWKPVARPRTVEEMQQLITKVMIGASGDRHPFVVVRRSDEVVIGSTTLHHLDTVQLRAEIGWTWLDRGCWGQGYNEDTKRVVLGYCFGVLRLRRVEFTVDNLNVRSQRALERLGFVYEGTLRSHRFRLDKTRSDTVVYSVVAEEWPDAAARLDRMIDERTAGEPRTTG